MSEQSIPTPEPVDSNDAFLLGMTLRAVYDLEHPEESQEQEDDEN